MRRRIWTIAAGLAALAALIAVSAAVAAYTSPTLGVTQTSAATTIKASLSPDDDPTASVRIFVPTGTQVTTTQAPGTNLGPVAAVVKALDLGGADLPLTGQLVVAAPGQVPAEAQSACLQSTVPLATWVMVLTAAGQTLTVPTYLVVSSGAQAALGPAYIQICLPPPDVPSGTPGRATFGAKVYSATLGVTGVFSPVPTGAWVAFWTPYTPGAGTVNVAGTVASPAAVASGAVRLAARSVGSHLRGAAVSGQVTQAGQPRAGATVTLFAGAKANRLKKVARKTVNTTGSFGFVVKSGTFFRATVVAASGPAAPLCTALAAALAPIPCVNPTTNGFIAQSKTIKKRR
jgi:hypothetical protein